MDSKPPAKAKKQKAPAGAVLSPNNRGTTTTAVTSKPKAAVITTNKADTTSARLFGYKLKRSLNPYNSVMEVDGRGIKALPPC
mmetsp:Transcript_3114/g.4721  ORF Transcript_3114/g.4721 Transcript_3114/m.4721 type:complete len:83 (+) Transcript_3114:1449-1697(+)